MPERMCCFNQSLCNHVAFRGDTSLSVKLLFSPSKDKVFMKFRPKSAKHGKAQECSAWASLLTATASLNLGCRGKNCLEIQDQKKKRLNERRELKGKRWIPEVLDEKKGHQEEETDFHK